jgi:transcriptional regulator GlxA family with amidase domain
MIGRSIIGNTAAAHGHNSLASCPTKPSSVKFYDVHYALPIAALEVIERDSGKLPRRTEVARWIGISTRQLDRLFAAKLKRSRQDNYRATLSVDRNGSH